MEILETLQGLVTLMAIYFAPALVARLRERQNVLAIFLLNLSLGWTGIGWVGAMIWAVTSPGKAAAPEAAGRPDVTGEIERLEALRERGAIDDAEYQRLKARVTGAPDQAAFSSSDDSRK